MKFNECGRSMVETLAVLAIIGILSVSGVYGYGLAMKKHRTNELIRELNFRANQVATMALIGAQPEDVEGLENAFLHSGEYSFTAVSVPGEKKFKIVIHGSIPEDICRQLYSQLGSNSVIRAMGQPGGNYTSADDCVGQEEKETLGFIYNVDLSKGDSIDSGDFTPETDTQCTGNSVYCENEMTLAKCNNGKLKRVTCSWGCENDACKETCTDESGKAAFQFTNSTQTVRYCMVSTCQNGSWNNETPYAFCKIQTNVTCTINSCSGVDNTALAEFRGS